MSETAQAKLPRVGFIVGPTGSGKTALALALAQRLGAEIVNADSRLVYRGLDIGTAKPSESERRRVLHHLIDIRLPDDPMDVAEFAALAHSAIAEIVSRRCRVLVVGGSGLYLRVLRGGIFEGPPASRELRDQLAARARAMGVEQLHRELAAVDPAAARRIGVHDLYRITRALEVFELTGEPISTHQRRHAFARAEFESRTLAIDVERKQLYENIDRRFDEMIAAGFVDEVRGLLAAGYSPERPPLKTIGYQQIAAYLRREIDLETAVARAKQESRRLAKRQLTWFRHEPDLVWLDPMRASVQAFDLLEAFYSDRSAEVPLPNSERVHGKNFERQP
jgi:tRNA dimethylallyltransferase